MSRPAHIHSGGEVVAAMSDGRKLICVGETVPTDGTAGYATGCLFIKTNGGAGSALHCNEGTAASCDFDVVTIA